MRQVKPNEEVWIRGCGCKWHRAPIGEPVELQRGAWSECRILVRGIVQIRTKRPEAGTCRRCEKK